MKNLIGNINISDFDYSLPDVKIAKHPLNERDQSKILIYKSVEIREDNFINISNYLPNNSLMLFNNTKVVRARMLFKRKSGAQIEIFLLEPITPHDYVLSFAEHYQVTWKCIVGNLKKWKEDQLEMDIPESKSKLTAKKVGLLSEGMEVEFTWKDENLSFARIIELCGNVPIPPYLNRESDIEDVERYQTVYAKPEGSVAAPTAGLHFTDRVFDSINKKVIEQEYITLHVGAGTFKPVKAEKIADHEMHTEHFFVSSTLIKKLVNQDRYKVVVGTTTLRTLESIYWLGVKAVTGKLNNPYFISQWEPYELSQDISVDMALGGLYNYLNDNKISTFSASTQIMIVPGYKIRMANALITNYHQPKSTLLLLVAAFIGEDWKKVYEYALSHDFRFLSYGDSSLLMKNEE